MMDLAGNHLWQSTLFAAAATLFTLFFRKNHARVRYWIWLAASIKFLIPFSLFIAIGSSLDFSWRHGAPLPPTTISYVENISQPFGSLDSSTTISEAVKPDRTRSIQGFLYAAWLCGIMAVCLLYLTRGRRLRTVLSRAQPLQDGRAHELLRSMALNSRLRTRIKLASSASSMEPGVFGIFRPMLLLPEGMIERLDDSQLEAIIAHEVAHVRRHDNLLSAIHMAIEALFWFHPMIWWLGAKLVQERERACDEEVLRLGKDPQAYAEGILKVCEFCLESPLACVAGVTGSDMKRRIQAIMTHSIGGKLSLAKKIILAMAGIIVLALPILIGFFNTPSSQAQSTEPKPSFDVVSIKPAPNCDRTRPADLGPGRMVLQCVTLRALIRGAYSDLSSSGKFNPSYIEVTGGPSWIDHDTLYIHAKAEAKASIQQMYGPMLQALLEERFQLKVHKELRDKLVYELTVAKSNPNLRPTKEGSCIVQDPNDFSIPTKIGDFAKRCGVGTAVKSNGPNTIMDYQGVSMTGLAMIIAPYVDRPVIDKTGLQGLFDFRLERPNALAHSGPVTLNGVAMPDIPEASDDATGSSIYAILKEQLGLKLSPASNSLGVIVIDHVEKPSEN